MFGIMTANRLKYTQYSHKEKAAMKRYQNLDGLRAFLCMGLAAAHMYGAAGYVGGVWDPVIYSLALLVIPFMVLSGFGICAGYLERFHQGQISLERFYVRRYSKILPFFAVTTAIGVAAEHSLRSVAEGLMELSLVFGFLPNNSNSFSVNGICWTLGTIFAFYLLFPFVSVLLKNKKRAWLALATSVVIQLLCQTLFMTEAFVVKGFVNRSNILYSMAFFLTGGLLYLYREEIERFVKAEAGRKWLLLLACVLASVGYYLLPHTAGGVDIADQKMAVIFALWCAYAIGAESFVLSNRVVRLFARYSMEIYLSHMIVLKGFQILGVTGFKDKNLLNFVLLFVLLMAATLVFVIAVYFCMDKAMGKIRQARKTKK